MASPLRYTLVSDGSTDRTLLPIINWLLESLAELEERGVDAQWADLRYWEREPGLAGKVAAALHHYPCDVVFVHRDAESSDAAVYRQRHDEIRRAMEAHATPFVGVVPVRMTEAWLLLEADAIRKAADNPASRAEIDLPPLRRLESISDPKERLQQLLLEASEKKGRRRDQFRRELTWRRCRVAELIDDFSPLKQLTAFARFAEETHQVVRQFLVGSD